MWQIDNLTAFAAERGWVRDRNGAEVWLVAVKCTFDIQRDGSTHVSADQPPVLHVPEYHGDAGASSIKYDADLVPAKRTTDVTVNGHAYAPDGVPIRQLQVGFRVGAVQKILRVTGDRRWSGTGISSPELFTKIPLVYERGFGGRDMKSADPSIDWDWRNPVGTGFAISRDHLSGVQLPNIEYSDDVVGAWKDRPRPAGFGPISGHWQPRAGFAGTYDDEWLRDRQPLLPVDFDERFYQSAPADQQSPQFLRGGEPVALRNLTPDGDLRFFVPKVFLGFETRFRGGEREMHSDRNLHSLIIEPDYPRVSVVWHSALPCHFKVQKLERTIVYVKSALTSDRAEDEPDELELV